jgi:hypothetical protein
MMESEEIEVVADEAMPEYDNPEDLLDAVAGEYTNLPGIRDYFPTEYVVYYTGPRGSSKTLQLARHSLKGLANGEKVFTNIELFPEKIGIDNKANPVGLEFLLTFDQSLMDAIIVISEIDTWFDRMRETSTGNRLGGKFLQQLRKKGLRIFFDTQDYLPGVLMRQVDKLVYCNDFCFTQWGRDRNLPKGTTFWYDCYDYSGIFTGWRGYHWREALYHAERVWPLFNTYQIYDPLQFARKIKVVGGDMEYDQDTKQLYAPGERQQQLKDANEYEGREFSTTLFEKLEGIGFLQILIERNAIRDDPARNNRLLIVQRIVNQCLASLIGEPHEAAKNLCDNLRDEAVKGHVAELRNGEKYIRIYRPSSWEEPNEN